MRSQFERPSGEGTATDFVTPACRACGGSSAAWARAAGYDMWRCRDCATLFALASIEATRGLYAHYYDHTQFELSPFVRASLERIVQSIEIYRSTNRWLDVGYGAGGLLEIASEHGWQCHGTEVSPSVLARGAQRGWTVAEQLRDDVFPPAGFDVITMIELLEHVPDPKMLLADAARLMRPGGVLFLTTPNAHSLNRVVLGARWTVLSPPEHLTIWTHQGLAAALSECGLDLIRARTEGLNPAEIVARWRRRGDDVPVVDRNQAALALNAGLSGSRRGRLLKKTANALLNMAGIGDTLKAWAVRRPA